MRLMQAMVTGRSAGLRTKPICYVDIGARGGLARSWKFLWRWGLVAPIFVEPEPAAAKTLREDYPDARILECALGDVDGTGRSLYVTRQPGCTSMLKPAPSPRAPSSVHWMYEVDQVVSIDTRRSGDALAERGVQPEVIKLDVQGLELAILKGLGSTLQQVVALELEVSFVATYEAQPMFQEIFDFLIDAGFGMTQLTTFGVADTGSAFQANAIFGNRRLNTPRSTIIEDITLHASGGAYAP
jgi:FkbM family methyltransferase